MPEVVVIYHYYEASDLSKDNLKYFLDRGYNKNVDYIVVIAGGCTVDLPNIENIRYVFVPNFQFDFGGFAHVINNIFDIDRYKFFIFVNSSVRGPFLPQARNGLWTEPFVNMLVDDVKLCGSTINILSPSSSYSHAFKYFYGFAEPFSHVQSMVFAMDRSALQFLVQKGFFRREIGPDKIDAIVHYEILMSQLIIKNSWNISCLLPEYRCIDYRKAHNDVNPTSVSGDPCYRGAYFNRSLHPFETIFVKSNRNLIDLALLRQLEASQLARIGEESSAYRASRFDKIVDEIVSAWKGHKNFAIWLVRRLRPEVIVDLGVDFGFSTFCFAAAGIGHVYGIDSFEGDEHAGLRDTKPIVMNCIKMLGLANVTLVKGDFESVARAWDKDLDILHIDGLHTYEAVKRDYESWAKFVKPTGVILLHDTCVAEFGVRRLFDEIDLPKTNFLHSHGLGAVSKDRELIREIAAKFETLIEPGEFRREIVGGQRRERRATRGIRYACERAYFEILSALRRPGRVARFLRFCKRMVAPDSSPSMAVRERNDR